MTKRPEVGSTATSGSPGPAFNHVGSVPPISDGTGVPSTKNQSNVQPGGSNVGSPESAVHVFTLAVSLKTGTMGEGAPT